MYKTIDKQEAKKLYNNGGQVVLVPSSHDVNAEWSKKIKVSKKTHFLPFDRLDKLIAETHTIARDNNKLAYYIED